MEKKTFIEPEVTKVEFEFNEVIADSSCTHSFANQTLGAAFCAVD